MATSATSGSTNSSHKRDASHLDFSITNLSEQPLAPKRLRRLVPSEMEKTEAVWQTHAASQTLSASSNSNSNNGANGTGGCAEISMGTILSTGHYHEQNPALAAQTVSQIQTSDFPSDPGPGLSDPGEGIDV